MKELTEKEIAVLIIFEKNRFIKNYYLNGDIRLLGSKNLLAKYNRIIYKLFLFVSLKQIKKLGYEAN